MHSPAVAAEYCLCFTAAHTATVVSFEYGGIDPCRPSMTRRRNAAQWYAEHPAIRARFAEEYNGQQELRAYCPLHEDPGLSTTPSASFNLEKGVGYCHVCQKGFSLRSLTQESEEKEDREGSNEDFDPFDGAEIFDSFNEGLAGKTAAKAEGGGGGRNGSRFDFDAGELPDDATLNQWHMRLMNRPDLLRFLTDERGLSVATLVEFRIGHDGSRYTIPIFDEDGVLRNVRRYAPNAKQKSKMISIKGHGTGRVFLPWVVRAEQTVVLVEGELDAIIGQQHGLPCVSCTAGAGQWQDAFSPLFTGKHVYIFYDNDDAGRKGALQAARSLIRHVASVHVMENPLPDRGMDLTDWFVASGWDAVKFRALMDATPPHTFERHRPPPPSQGKRVTLAQSMPSEQGPLELAVTVAGNVTPPFLIPRKVTFNCNQDKGPVCNICELMLHNGEMEVVIQPDDPVIMEMVDQPTSKVQKALRDSNNVKCVTHSEIDIETRWSVEHLYVTDNVDTRGEDTAAPIYRQVFSVGTHYTEPNSAARVVGQQVAATNDQRGALQAWRLEPTQTNLDSYQVAPEVVEALRVFQPAEGQPPLKKLGEVVRDLAANVTHIYGRPALHLAYMLVWHSLMDFGFQGQRVGKGWLEMIVLGDTRTGKSEAAQRMARHYGAGRVSTAESATFAGLIGGLEQMGNRFQVRWGLIPLNDRRLVVLDEVGGLVDKGIVENMSSIRSSGVAQIVKIQSAQTSARTRLIWIGNPVEGKRIAELSGGGMAALKTLIRNPEDIARFDFAMAASGEDVSQDLINTVRHTEVPHVYTSELCRELVLWAWSRRADQVSLPQTVQAHVMTHAAAMGSRYIPDPPLVQAENVRVKLARIAAAIAAATYSASVDGERVLVRKEHVDAAVQFLDYLYRQRGFNYAGHSARELRRREEAQQNKERTRGYLQANPVVLATLQAIGVGKFKTRDFRDYQALDEQSAAAAVATLGRMRMIRPGSQGFSVMSQELIEVLEELES